jgi:hypothetical protein
MLIQQPQQGIPRVNWSCPLNRNLKELVLGSRNTTLVNKKPIVLGTNATKVISSQGKAWKGATTNSPVDIGATAGLNTIVDVTKSWSIATRIYVSQLGISQVFVADHASNAASMSVSLSIGATNTYVFTLYCNFSGSTSFFVNGGTCTIGWHDILVTYDVNGSGFNQYLYVDGVLIGSNIQNTNPLNTLAAARLRLCSTGIYTTSTNFPGQMLYCAFFNENLGGYAKTLADNPWQLFEQQKSASWLYSQDVINTTDFFGVL